MIIIIIKIITPKCQLLSQALGIEENINETKLSRVKSNEIFVFVERGKPGHLMKTFRRRGKQTYSHIAWSLGSNTGNIDGRRVVSLQRKILLLSKNKKTGPHLAPLSSTFPSHLRLTNLLSHSFVF